MFDFEKELAKYKPLMETDALEENLQSSQMQDILDILQHLTVQKKEEKTEQAEEAADTEE